MCDQTEVQYLPGEVVWVKLRALWWPGLVQDYDSLPEEITCSLRKRPIATVKFFQEDSYEYVHKLDLIYHYNCSRKHEFIKKGLDLCRKKTADRPATMDFFPMDIVTAEETTGGDPNILQDEAFKPEEKPKYTSLFGEKKKFGKKKGKEDSPLKDKVARRKKLTSKLQAMGWLSRGITANIIYPSPDTPRIVTHRRFLNKARNPDGKSDYEVRILEQKCEDEPRSFAEKEYQCVMCGYVTRRLNVIVLHFNSTHSRRTKNIFPTPSILKGGSFRNPLLKLRESRKSEGGKSSLFSRKKTSIKIKSDKVKRVESEVESSEDETPKPLPVKKEKGKPGRKRKVKVEEKEQDENEEAIKKPKVLDSLLADWEEDAEQEKDELEQDKNLKDDDEEEDNDDDDNGDESISPDHEIDDKSSVSLHTSSTSKSKEVFEFDPDEDDNIDFDLAPNVKGFGRRILDFDLTPNVKGFGRRIPRVIETSKDKKQKSSSSKKSSKEKSSKKEKDDDFDDIETLLAETSVPSLPSFTKSSNFSLDSDNGVEVKSGDESSPKAVLKEHNDTPTKSSDESVKRDEKVDKSKNSEPEVDLAVEPSSPPQEPKESSTAKVTVQMIPDVEGAGTDILVEGALSGDDLPQNEGKPGQPTSGGDHTYVSGSAGRKRRRSLLPLEKNDGTLDIMSMPVVLDDNFMVEESPRANKQPFLPKVEGSNVKQTPRRVGRPPKKGGAGSRGGKGSKGLKTLPPQKSPKSHSSHRRSKSPSPHLSSKSPPPFRGSKSPSPHPVSMSPPPAPGPKSPSHHASPKSPPPHRSPRSPAPEPYPKSPEQSTKSPSHRQGSKSPAHLSPKRLAQGPKSPIPKSPELQRGPKSPMPYHSPKSPKSPQPYQSPGHQSPMSPQGLQGPKSPSVSASALLSPRGPKSPTLFAPDTKVLKSPPRSPLKTTITEAQGSTPPGLKSPVKSPPPSPLLLSPTSPSKSVAAKVLTQVSSVSKAGATLKKINTSGAVIVQSKPDLQPEACGIGKILASSASPVASSSSSTVKTIKVAVSGTPGSSPVVVSKAGTPGTPRKVMIVQGKGGTQKMLVPTEASQQLLSNIGSGKKIMVITKGSVGSSGKLVLTSQQQKILASGGKVTTSSGQVVTSKGAVMSSVAKLVSAKPSTSGATPIAGGVELSSEPPALVKTDGKKTYKIITTPQSKGNFVLNTSGGQILLPVSSIGASGSGVTTLSGSKQFILPVGAKQMKLLNTVGGTGQKVILHMKSSPTKAGVASSPKTVQPIVPKTVQSISPKSVQTISPKVVQSISPKTVQSITPKSVLPITPKTGQPITPKPSQPMKVTKIATMVQPVPQLTPIGAPKVARPKQVKTTVVKQAKSPAQPKSPRKSGASAKTAASVVATSSTSATPMLLQGANSQKRSSGIVPNPNLKVLAPQATPTKKISLAAKPTPLETPTVSSVPSTMQVVTSAVPGLEQIQTSLLPSVDTSSAMTLPTSTQQYVTVQSDDGGSVMYLIDNSSLIGLDGANQANLGNIILTFDNMGQPTSSSAASDFTFTTPSSGQDILAEALANTQVLQSDAPGSELGLDTSGLLSSHSSSTIYQPSLSHGVLETSLTLNQPIMTPLEDLSAVSALQPPPSAAVSTSIDLPTTITVPDITISTSSYASLPIPSATIQSTVFSEAQNVSTYSTTIPEDGNVFIEAPNVEGDSFLTADSVFEQTSEGASMPLLDG